MWPPRCLAALQPSEHFGATWFFSEPSQGGAGHLHLAARPSKWTEETNGPPKLEEVMSNRWSINITPAERVARVAIGGLAAIAGAFLLGGAASTLAVVLELLLVLAGLDLVVTGALGHCPLYAKLGHVPASLKGRTS
jgi:hypothetical protein